MTFNISRNYIFYYLVMTLKNPDQGGMDNLFHINER